MTSARPYLHHVAGRAVGSGPVVAVLTDHPTDVTVAAHAAELAARHRTMLIAAAAVNSPGIDMRRLLAHTRNRRLNADSVAITGRVAPILDAAGIAWMRSTLLLPLGSDALRALPPDPLRQLVGRFSAAAVVTARPLHDPTGTLVPTHHHRPAGATRHHPATF